MNPEASQIGKAEWVDHTTLHPVGLAMVLVCGIALLLVPRRYAIWPFILIACFVAPAQRLVVLGLDFNLLRLMVLFGWVRIIGHREWRGFVWQTLDKLLIVWAVVSTVMYTLLMGSTAAFVNRLGISFDAVGMYFVFRCLIRSWRDIDWCILGFMVLVLPVAVAFIIENRTGKNVFSAFGGVPAVTLVREGRLRCQGAFAHSILAGCFWAPILPLIIAQWWSHPTWRRLIIVSLLSCCLIVVCCASSTPVMSVLAVLLGGAMFRFRRQMKLLRWGIVIMLVLLHIVMKAPVWHLISRVSAVGGSTGYHRYKVIDQAIKRFGDWWLLGTRSVEDWGIWAGDITNQYVVEGITGGVLKLVLFVAIIVVCFRSIGKTWRHYSTDRRKVIIVWALGVSMFVHCITFIGVTYFGQIIMVWYLTLAMISSLTPSGRWRRGILTPSSIMEDSGRMAAVSSAAQYPTKART